MNKDNKLKLGWLIPYSGIFRDLKNDLQQGLDMALSHQPINRSIVNYPEYVRSGGTKEAEEALKKLLQYEQVDMVIGVLSAKTALQLIPLLESRQTPAFLLNLGADIPTRQLSSDYLFYNSLHLWKSEWVMGKWTQERFGGEPSINLSIYESGYGLHESFRSGTAAAGAAAVQLNIVKNITGSPDTLPLINYILEQQPRHAHALLSGKEGSQFLQLFREHRLETSVSISVNPFMVEEGLMNTIPAGLDLYNASTWSQTLDSPTNERFVREYASAYGQPPNAFSLLAYEAGLVLAAALSASGNASREVVRQAIGQVSPEGPRGPLRLSTRPLQTGLPVYIRKPVLNAPTGSPTNMILETKTGLEWDSPHLTPDQSAFTGWQNPYLCV